MSKSIIFIKKIWILFFAFVLVTPALAQVDQLNMANRIMSGRSVNYYYAKPGDITITVSIWGFIQRPGLYEVASNTDLINLISLAGGPNSYAKLNNIQIVRAQQTPDGKVTRKKFKVNLKNLVRVNEEKIKLKPGDVIYVNHTAWYTIKEVFSVTSSVAILTTAIYYLTRILNGTP